MFCNYCGASNPDGASFCNKCGNAVAQTPASGSGQAQPIAAQPIPYVAKTSPAAPPRTPAPVVLASSIRQETHAPIGGTLTLAARTEFIDGLTAELRRQIEDKCIPGAIVAGIITLIAVARFNMTFAFILAFVLAGIVFKIVKSILEDKYLRPIADFSDEMLVTRYNEAKADRRAARTRTAISWAVVAIIAVVLAVAWLAAHRQ
jgi:hypothetical protein